ncbi:MAG: hypothetical protein FJ319_09110 [SAR202 cluster bacterium]|nr:hypothetical protein [SAR202 cluster bacterium]
MYGRIVFLLLVVTVVFAAAGCSQGDSPSDHNTVVETPTPDPPLNDADGPTVTMADDSGIAAVSWGDGRIDIVGHGTDNHMYHYIWDDMWTPGWSKFATQMTGGAAMASRGDGMLDIFWKGCQCSMTLAVLLLSDFVSTTGFG